MKRLRVAVIGVGHLGGLHAQKLAGMPGVELVGVVDPIESRRLAAAAQCGTQPFAEHRPLLDRLDAAVIATPAQSHHAIASELLSRGIHLLVEKPLCPTAAQADHLVRLARRRGAVLQVGHVERFNPAIQAVRPHLARPKYIEAVRAGPFSFRSTDIGVVLDLMIHDLDLVLWLVGSRVRRIEALGLSVLGGHEDVANARLEFQCGCVAVLSASRVSYQAVRRMQVWSARAFASVDFAACQSTVVFPDQVLLERRFDVDSAARELPERKWELLDRLLPQQHRQHEPVDGLLLELNDFVESIGNGRVPQVPGEQGRDAVALAERVLARIAAHAWDERPAGRVGPMAIPRPSVIPTPHWQLAGKRSASKRREAG
ncbi:MAG: Gfo/Idh/MocA family oxidoreductase [Thermoguttaceae bacterium]